MTPINKVILNKDTSINPIWIMRQAGRYLPEFREIRSKNTDFIKLCLDENLSSEITVQPLRRFNLDAAIIFSDILMLPYALGQKVEFKKNFGPILGDLDISKLSTFNEIDFVKKIFPVYKALLKVSENEILKNKNTIGFVGAPWTLLVYILNKDTSINPIWVMRQAGRYLPEFRKIRSRNTDFIKLCLDENLSSEITLQPLRRFTLDAAIIFSDILMLPYALGQNVEFKKNFGPILGDLDITKLSNFDEIDFVKKIFPVYKAISKVSENELLKNKNTIGFVGAPWTLLVYILNKQSPKKKNQRRFF